MDETEPSNPDPSPTGAAGASDPRPPGSAIASGTLSPNAHLRLLIELLKPAGPELARRWVAALMLVPGDEREDVVESVEAKIVETYGHGDPPGGG